MKKLNILNIAAAAAVALLDTLIRPSGTLPALPAPGRCVLVLLCAYILNHHEPVWPASVHAQARAELKHRPWQARSSHLLSLAGGSRATG